MATPTLAEFLARYAPDGQRVAADITAERDADSNSPLVIVRHGRFAAVLALMPFNGNSVGDGAHLCIDVHPFVDGLDATAGVFGMTEGRKVTFPDETGQHSHGWPSAHGISVLIGEQDGPDDPDAIPAAAARLKASLEYVRENGFGECVDDDSIIEEAATRYLEAIGGRRPMTVPGA